MRSRQVSCEVWEIWKWYADHLLLYKGDPTQSGVQVIPETVLESEEVREYEDVQQSQDVESTSLEEEQGKIQETSIHAK